LTVDSYVKNKNILVLGLYSAYYDLEEHKDCFNLLNGFYLVFGGREMKSFSGRFLVFQKTQTLGLNGLSKAHLTFKTRQGILLINCSYSFSHSLV